MVALVDEIFAMTAIVAVMMIGTVRRAPGCEWARAHHGSLFGTFAFGAPKGRKSFKTKEWLKV